MAYFFSGHPVYHIPGYTASQWQSLTTVSFSQLTIIVNGLKKATHLLGKYRIVLYREFLEWPKYKLQGPLEKQDELTNS